MVPASRFYLHQQSATPFLLRPAPGPPTSGCSPCLLLVTFGSSASPVLICNAPSLPVHTHGFSPRICSFLFLLATCTYFWEFICCLSFSENITCAGFLPPPALCSLWPGERRGGNNMSSKVLQLKLIRNSGFPAGKPPLC